MLVNIHSDFLAPGFLTGDDVMGDIGMLSVNPSGVETISASRISLNCCWLLHLPACLYDFWFFQDISVHIYHLFLKKGWIPMVFTSSFSRGYRNITLSTTHGCTNVSIEITESIALVIILYLIHLAAWLDLPSFIKHIYDLPTGVNNVGVL